jgi:DNA-binding response OmpR family regulator
VQLQTPLRLVIVDDHELLARTLAIALRLSGLDVETVAGPTAAAVVACARVRAPALVMLDLDLGPPLGSGLDLIEPLVAVGAMVIMMTGVEEQDRLDACVEAGATAISRKKYGFDNLVSAVYRAIERAADPCVAVPTLTTSNSQPSAEVHQSWGFPEGRIDRQSLHDRNASERPNSTGRPRQRRSGDYRR